MKSLFIKFLVFLPVVLLCDCRFYKGIAGVYQFSLYDMKIASQKANGSDWDPLDYDPDVQFVLNIPDSDKKVSEVFPDKRSIKGKIYSTRIILKKNDILHLKVFDFDLDDNDLIGEKIFTREDILSILKSEVPVVFRFGQVEKLGILLEDIGE